MIRMFLIVLLALPSAALAQRIPSHCIALVDRAPQVPIRLASPNLAKDEVLLTYLDHSMYQIDTHGGLSVVTDYNGSVLGVPDVVTMNHAHSSHWTFSPNPKIKHVLRGWDPEGGIADHNVDLGEMLVRNVTTDIRSSFSGTEPDGNSIFIFEVAGLCIGHLGHIHHEPTEEQYARIGRLDVVMAPVDGGMTVNLPTMVKMLKRMRALIVLPVHWRGRFSLDQFTDGMKDTFVIQEVKGNEIVVSLDTLPRNPTVMIVPPRFYPQFDE